jgi:hypothetical protein
MCKGHPEYVKTAQSLFMQLNLSNKSNVYRKKDLHFKHVARRVFDSLTSWEVIVNYGHCYLLLCLCLYVFHTIYSLSAFCTQNKIERFSKLLKDSNDGALHSVLLFFWTWSVLHHSNTRPLRFARWLCFRLQVKISVLLGPWTGISPFCRIYSCTRQHKTKETSLWNWNARS